MSDTIQLNLIFDEVRVLNVVLEKFLTHDEVGTDVFDGDQGDIALMKGIAARVYAQYMVRKLGLGRPGARQSAAEYRECGSKSLLHLHLERSPASRFF